jgi:hypothetical protein
MGNSHKNLLHRNHWANCNQTNLKIVKKGDEIKKKSSLKLLSQSQPNFAEISSKFSSY